MGQGGQGNSWRRLGRTVQSAKRSYVPLPMSNSENEAQCVSVPVANLRAIEVIPALWLVFP